MGTSRDEIGSFLITAKNNVIKTIILKQISIRQNRIASVAYMMIETKLLSI